MLLEPPKLGIDLGCDQEARVSPLKHCVDDTSGGPRDRHLHVGPPIGRERSENCLQHPRLVAIGEPWAGARVETDAHIGAQGGGCQVAIPTPAGVFFPDFLWEAERVIGEADGRIKYEDSAAIVREKEREQHLRDLGYGIVRWLGKEIHLQPGVVVARVGRALGA